MKLHTLLAWLLLISVVVASNITTGSGGGGGTWGSITGTLSSQSDLNTALGAKAPTASATFTGVTTVKSVEFTSLYDNGNSGTAKTLDFGTNGNVEKLTLTGNCTLTLTAPSTPMSCTLYVYQDGTGGRTLTFPSGTNFSGNVAPVITTTASACDVVSMIYDGSAWHVAVSIPDSRHS